MGERLAKFCVQFHRWLLLLAVVIAAASLPVSRQLTFDWQIASMFDASDPMAESYRRLQQRFGGDEIVLAVYRDPQLWSPEGLGRLRQLTQRLSACDGVSAGLSLTEIERLLRLIRPGSWLRSTSSPLLDEQDDLAQALLAMFAGYTHQPWGEYVAVVCLLEPDRQASAGNVADRRHKIAAIRSVLADVPLPATAGTLVGEPVLVADGLELVEQDGRRLGLASTVLVALVLLGCFRSWRWMLIPLLLVQWSLLATRASLVVLQLELTMVSSTLTALLTVIGVATCMHLLISFQAHRRAGLSREQALRQALTQLLVPIAWACVTDAIGFLALLSADVGPVRDFGLMMAIGSLMVWLGTVLLIPGLTLLGTWDPDPRQVWFDARLRNWLERLLVAVQAHRRWTWGMVVGWATLAVFGCLRLEVQTDFTKNFRSGTPLVQGYTVIERELGGAGVWDIMLPAPPVLTSTYLEQVVALESRLRGLRVSQAGQHLALTKVLSVADANSAATASPWLAWLGPQQRLAAMRGAMPAWMDSLLTDTPDADGKRWLRVMLRSPEQAPAAAKLQLIQQVRKATDEFTAQPSWRQQFDHPARAEVTGYHVLLSRLVSSVLADQWICFVVATGGILIAMSLATGSLKLALAAWLPNALPILTVLGGLGWAGLPINLGAAMIAAVSMGLSVDSSLHYLLHYQRQRRVGNQRLAAVSAQRNVGLAAVLSTAALVAGFLSMTGSQFMPTCVFGWLASLTMLGGVLGNLTFLPLFLPSEPSYRAQHDTL